MLKNKEGIIRALTNKAEALITADRLPEASATLDKADAEAGNSASLGALRQKTRALLLMRRGDLESAGKLLEKSLAAASNNDPSSLSSIRYALGQLALTKKRYATASDHFGIALDMDRAAGAYFHIAQDLAALGTSHLQQGNPKEAATCFKRSAKIFALLNNGPKVKAVVQQLEQSARLTGVPVEATLHWINQWLAGHTEANLCR